MSGPVRVGQAELWLGDCREVLPLIAARVDCVLTDPPFGIAYCSGHRTGRLWSEDGIRGDADVSVRDGALALVPGVPALVFGSRKAALPPGHRMTLVWDKGGALGMGALDLPWKPDHEEVYVIGRGFSGPRDEGSVLRCPPVQSMARNGRLHPNEKPVPLLRRLLAKMPGRTVCDPFMGSAATGEASLREGRAFIGVEADERYFEVACRRLERTVRQADLFVAPRPAPAHQPDMLAGAVA